MLVPNLGLLTIVEITGENSSQAMEEARNSSRSSNAHSGGEVGVLIFRAGPPARRRSEKRKRKRKRTRPKLRREFELFITSSFRGRTPG